MPQYQEKNSKYSLGCAINAIRYLSTRGHACPLGGCQRLPKGGEAVDGVVNQFSCKWRSAATITANGRIEATKERDAIEDSKMNSDILCSQWPPEHINAGQNKYCKKSFLFMQMLTVHLPHLTWSWFLACCRSQLTFALCTMWFFKLQLIPSQMHAVTQVRKRILNFQHMCFLYKAERKND